MPASRTRRRNFRVAGIVVEAETGRPLADLIVRAFDRDMIFDDKIGFTSTDSDGRFEIRYGADQFRDLWESRPDLYLRIYDASGARLLHETTDAVRPNASEDEHYRIAIPANALSGGANRG
jgi:hypothetical protein